MFRVMHLPTGNYVYKSPFSEEPHNFLDRIEVNCALQYCRYMKEYGHKIVLFHEETVIDGKVPTQLPQFELIWVKDV